MNEFFVFLDCAGIQRTIPTFLAVIIFYFKVDCRPWPKAAFVEGNFGGVPQIGHATSAPSAVRRAPVPEGGRPADEVQNQ